MLLNKFLPKNKSNKITQQEQITINTPRIHDLIAPSSFNEYQDYLKVGNKYFRTLAVSVYPISTYITWLDEVYLIGNVIVSINSVPQDPAQVKKKLTKEITNKGAQYIIEKQRGNILNLPELEKNIADYESLRERIQTNQDQLYSIQILIGLYAETLDELNRKSTILGDILARQDVRVIPLDLRQPDAYKSLLANCDSKIIDHWRNGTTGNFISMLPISNVSLTHPKGIWLGRGYYTGKNIFFDQFIGPPYLNNQHVAIFGYSGSGKSTTLKLFELRGSIKGVRNISIDVDGEHAAIAELAGGINIKITPGQLSGINPFELLEEEDDDGNIFINVQNKISEIKYLFITMVEIDSNGKVVLTAKETALLTEVIGRLYTKRDITRDPKSLYRESRGSENGQIKTGYVKKEMPTWSEMVEDLKECGAEDLALYLIPYLSTGEKGMFDCNTSINLEDRPHINFDLSGIKDDNTRLYAAFVIYTWVWYSFVLKYPALQKAIENEETWMFSKHELAAKFLEEYSRRGRKYNFSLIPASQQIEEFLRNDTTKAIINNCSTIILLRQNAQVVDQVVEYFKLSEGCRDYLSRGGPGDAIIITDGVINAVKIMPTEFEMPFIDTRPEVRYAGR